jgi:transcriptional regulator with XRE-family HTH domain
MVSPMDRVEGLPLALRALRERSKMSQAALSEGAGTSQGQVSAYELGKAEPGFSVLERILRALGCDFADLEDALRIARGEEPRTPSGQTGGSAADKDFAFVDHFRQLALEELRRQAPDVVRSTLRDILGGHRDD